MRLARSVVHIGSLGVVLLASSTSSAQDWQQLLSPSDIVPTFSFTAPDSRVAWAGKVYYPDAIFRTVDGGATLASTAQADLDPWVTAVHPTRPETFYVRHINVPTGITVTTDGGATWSVRGAPFASWISILAVEPVSGTLLALAPADGLFRSADDGATWTAVSVGPFTDVSADSFTVDVPHRRVFFLHANATGGADAWVSTDGGATWGPMGHWPLVARVIADPSDASTLYLGNLRSSDGGLSWAPLRFAPSAVHPAHSNVLYAVANELTSYSDHVVMKSKDGGVCWERFSPQLGYLYGVAVNTASDVLAGATGDGLGGLWRTVDTDLERPATVDLTPPVVSGAASPATLAPNGGHLVDVVITAVASDAESCVTSITIGGTPVRLENPTTTVSLAAKNGAVYGIPIVARDAFGNEARADVVVKVGK